MSARRITILTATALIAAASVSAGLVGPASAATRSDAQSRPSMSTATFVGYGYGEGATSAAAEDAAVNFLEGSYACYPPISLVSDTENPNGTWYAVVDADCWAYV